MTHGLFQYLKKRHKIELSVLVAVALVLVATLLFTPIRIYLWVEEHRIILMWVTVVLLTAITGVIWAIAADLKEQLRQWEQGTVQERREQETMYKFYDEKGDLKLIVRPDMLFYLEAADNYVQIHYMNAGKMEKILIRNTLKNIEWRFRDMNLVRCHRSYIVNLDNVKVLKRSDGDVMIDFGNEKIAQIPVSRSYGEKVFEKFA
jgi:DNA-binding LytR/AlgR family response regulator